MRKLASLFLIALLVSAGLSPVAAAEPSFRRAAIDPAASFHAPARLAMAADGAASPAKAEEQMSLMSRQTLIGVAALGGAFAIGLLASGSLSGALGAAGVVAITYAVLP